MGRHSGLGNADDTDGDTPAGVAGRLRLEVVGFLVNDHATADDRRGTVEAEVRIIEIDGGFAVRVGRDVAQITNMALGRVDPSMHFVGRVVMATRCQAVLRPYAELVDVEALIALVGKRIATASSVGSPCFFSS